MSHPFQSLEADQPRVLDTRDQLPESVHLWSQAEIDALTLAWATRRPLLLRGDPGTGKTQLARAAAQHLEWQLLVETIHPRFEATDLVYRFDAVRRLADAQARRYSAAQEASYWQPGVLWQAYGWSSARAHGLWKDQPAPQGAPKGHVILIDEIDKADSDLPNSLLEVLGQRTIRIPQLGLQFGGVDAAHPLILITTNEERELPSAFLRRCIVLNLDPAPDEDYVQWLVRRGRAHFGVRKGRPKPLVTDAVLLQAARQLAADRTAARGAGLAPPGPAEYLDLIAALHELAPGHAANQRKWLTRLNAYAFVKHATQPDRPDLSQRRKALAVDPSSGSEASVE